MKKRTFIISLIVLLSSCGLNKSDLQEEIRSKEYEISELEDKISELESRIEELETENENLQEQINYAEDVIERAKTASIIWDDDMFMVTSTLNEY